MNATPLSLAGNLMPGAADSAAADDRAARPCAEGPFRLLLDEVWRQCEPRLAKVALGLGLHSDQAADALQDVYVMAVQQPPPIAAAEELTKWLVRVTVNRCQLEHRRDGRWRRLWTSLMQAWNGQHQSQAAMPLIELQSEVRRALATLAKGDRTLVVLRYFAELNSRQIGEIVSLPEATVRGRLRAARRLLAAELADWNESQ
jgi:RNA polymerase sigma-70 factor, ECF subfamily